jgi:hypothetical protein
MMLKWDYQKRTCDISMPGYITNVLNKFQHDTPKHPQHIPSKYVTPIYGAKTQYATRDETPLLSAKQCTNIQKITGSVLYYNRAVYTNVLMPLNQISTEQTKATEKTQATSDQLLDYLATHPDATIRYHKSDIILHIHSDAYYTSVYHARSGLGGLFYCGDKPPNSDKLNGSRINSCISPDVQVSSRPRTALTVHASQMKGKGVMSGGYWRPNVALTSLVLKGFNTFMHSGWYLSPQGDKEVPYNACPISLNRQKWE